jgi:hypothetical protein
VEKQKGGYLMGYFRDEMNEALGPKLGRVAFIGTGVIIVYITVSALFSFWPFSSAVGVVKKVTSAEAIISNYQWFYDQYNAIQAQAANLDALKEDAPEKSGLSMVLNSMIAEYNSRSRQITRNLWKASDLPYEIRLGGSK